MLLKIIYVYNKILQNKNINFYIINLTMASPLKYEKINTFE